MMIRQHASLLTNVARALLTSMTMISFTGALLLVSGQAGAFAPIQIPQNNVQHKLWDQQCRSAWRNSYLATICNAPSSSVEHFINVNVLYCTVHNPKCPNNQGGKLRMFKWENRKDILDTARYCVISNKAGGGKFFQQGNRPSNCQQDNF